MEPRKGSDFWLNWNKGKAKNHRRSLHQGYNNAVGGGGSGISSSASSSPREVHRSPHNAAASAAGRSHQEPNRNNATMLAEPNRNLPAAAVTQSPIMLRDSGRGGMSRSGPVNPYALPSTAAVAHTTGGGGNHYATTYGSFYPGSPALSKSTPAEGLHYLVTNCPTNMYSEGVQHYAEAGQYADCGQYKEAGGGRFASQNNNQNGMRCDSIDKV